MSKTTAPLTIIIARHGPKQSKKVIPGSTDDRNLDLTPEGMVQCRRVGKDEIYSEPPYDYILVITSNYLRARRTAEKMLEGAGYSIDDGINVDERSEIGLDDVTTPPHKIQSWIERWQDYFIQRMLEEFYRPGEGLNLRPMASYAASLLGVTIEGITMGYKRDGESGLFLVTTHSPIIDAFANSLYGSLIVESEGEHRVVDFPGAFGLCETISGIVNISKDPTVKFKIRGREVEYKKSELEIIRNMHLGFAGKQI